MSELNPLDPSDNVVIEEITEVVLEPRKRFPIPSYLRLPITWTGLLSAALVFALAYIITYAGQVIMYSTYSIPALGVTLTVAYFLGFLLASLGPAIILGSRQGLMAGIKVLVAEILWFVILFAIMYYMYPAPPVNTLYPGGF